MRWKIVLEGTDEFGSAHRSELMIDKDMERLSAGEIGFSIEDGKTIIAHLQQVVVNQQCEAYVLTSRFCMDCKRFRRIKDYGKRKIRTVFGCVEVRNPRIMNCQRCLPHFCDAWTVLRDICPDQATPELMERSARLGSLLPYRKAAEVMAEFLPIKPTESFVTLRHRTLKVGERLDEKARRVRKRGAPCPCATARHSYLRRGALQGAARVTVPPSLGRKVWLEPISEGF